MNASNNSWTWGGRIHMVPEDFRFSICNLRTIWDLWWGGDRVKRIGPYRFLKKYDVTIRKEKQYLSKARTTINILITFVVGAQNIYNLSISERDAVSAEGFNKMCKFVRQDIS